MSRRVLALIPARAGSKGIPHKNERLLGGRTLIERCAEAATASGVIDRTCLSTDSERIAEIGRDAGVEVPFIRPHELAGDETPMLPVVEHALRYYEGTGWSPDLVVLLQPTAPLRKGSHVAAAVQLLEERSASSVASVVPIPDHFAPHYAMRLEDGRLVPFLADSPGARRRQDVTPAFSRDGTVYVFRRTVILDEHDLYGDNCLPLVLDPAESVNLDTEADWAAAEERLHS